MRFMYGPFDLPVRYKGEQLELPARLLLQGYVHKFEVEVNGQTLLFEPDEERDYRVVVDAEEAERSKIDAELLRAIAEAIEAVVK